MTEKYTPGPWFVVEQRPRKHANGDRLLIQSGTANICTLDVAGREYDKDKANARLIAAAPDLLAACKRALHLVEDEDNNKLIVEMPGSFGLLLDLQNAIEKATGEKP